MLWPAGPAAALPFAPLELPEVNPGAPVIAAARQTPAAAGSPVALPPGRNLVLASLGAANPPRVAEAQRTRPARPEEINLQRLEEQIAAGNRVIAEMLERVATMEREVAGLRARVQSLPGAVTEAPAPVGQAAQPRVAATGNDAAERHKRQQALIDNGLLLLAAGVLLLLAGVAYWTWGRPALKDRLREARLARSPQPAAA